MVPTVFYIWTKSKTHLEVEYSNLTELKDSKGVPPPSQQQQQKYGKTYMTAADICLGGGKSSNKRTKTVFQLK